MQDLEARGATVAPAHGMHLDLAVYGQPQSLRWVANPPPAAENTVLCDVAYSAPPPLHACAKPRTNLAWLGRILQKT